MNIHCKKLKNTSPLSCFVRIYVPSTININESDDSIFWPNKALELLCKLFGGSTCMPSYGAWLSEGKLVKEKIKIIFSHCTEEQLQNSLDEICDFCLKMKSELKQEAISLDINNELFLI
jgi:hypothetical protein